MKILFVVAHPDDEVLGAGATIHKLVTEGNKGGELQGNREESLKK